MDEFALIQQFFADTQAGNPSVVCGIGDDAAVLAPGSGTQLVACTDTLVAGRHFLPDANPYDVGWKSLAVNLSDLAAMGATQRWFLLALTLPEADEAWLAGFADGLAACAQRYGIALVGGDTTRGPLTITITALGEVRRGQAMRRDAAKAGDLIALTGPVGEGAAGLAVLQDPALAEQLHDASAQVLIQRYARPESRLAHGQLLAGLAHAAIDVSDGLLQDLGHVLDASSVGAAIDLAAIPTSKALRTVPDIEQRQQWQLAGGDDYELLVTLPRNALDEAQSRLARAGLPPLCVIGEIRAEPGLVEAQNGTTLSAPGFSHF